jgi:MoaA/NifB/PqqE/SkfB family radical SAM enzyme
LSINAIAHFDADWYRKEYKISETVDPVKHYLLVGYKLGYDPSPFFSTREYLTENLDVANAGVNPLLHYEMYGIKEGRYRKIRVMGSEIVPDNPSCAGRMEDGLLRIRITNACNGKCRYCGQLAWSKEEQSKSMDPKWYYEYCKPLYEKIKLLLITGGDAYVARESYNYMKFMSDNYPQITIMTESNGIAFNERFRELASDNLFKVHFSLNASNSAIYQKGCWEGPAGEAAYNKAIENLTEYLALLKSKNMECFAPDASMVINRDTANDVVGFAKLALELKISHVIFYFDYTESNMYSDYF